MAPRFVFDDTPKFPDGLIVSRLADSNKSRIPIPAIKSRMAVLSRPSVERRFEVAQPRTLHICIGNAGSVHIRNKQIDWNGLVRGGGCALRAAENGCGGEEGKDEGEAFHCGRGGVNAEC